MRYVVILSGPLIFAFISVSTQTASSHPTDAVEPSATVAADRPQGSIGAPSDDAVKAAEEAEAAAKEVTTTPVARKKIPAEKSPSSIQVRQIVFSPSGYLDKSELDKIAGRFVGQKLKISSLELIATAVNNLYSERKIGLAQAILSNVDIRSGVVNIELFEARLGEINFQSKNATADYLTWRLGLKPGELADTRRINERLVRLTLTDALRAEANFLPAKQRGFTNLNIDLKEPQRFGGNIGIDNFGEKSDGRNRLNFSLYNRSLSGRNDILQLAGTVSKSAWSINGSYSAIVTPDGTRLQFSASRGYSETLNSPVVTSSTRQAEVSLQVPLVLQNNVGLYGQVSGSLFKETGEIVGAPLVDQRGYLFSGGLSGSWNNDKVSLSVSQGLRYANWSDRITPDLDIKHVALFGDALGVVDLGDNYAASVQAGWQATLTGRSPVFYGMSVASTTAVRGYLDSGSKGDSGFYVRTQLERTTPFVLSKATPSPSQAGFAIYPYAFGDIGRAFDYTPGGGHTAQDTIASAGLGASVDFGRSVFAGIYAAKPLLDANGSTAAGRYVVKFSLNKSF